jgi:hypothetical protein
MPISLFSELISPALDLRDQQQAVQGDADLAWTD